MADLDKAVGLFSEVQKCMDINKSRKNFQRYSTRFAYFNADC
jgi:hypothetical protein